MTQLRNTRSNDYVAESWRARDNGKCYNEWLLRQDRYSTLKHLDVSQVQRDSLPWLCSETGGHVAECVNQGIETSLLIQRQRGADYILLHRITKVGD